MFIHLPPDWQGYRTFQNSGFGGGKYEEPTFLLAVVSDYFAPSIQSISLLN
jgi:hypothetical protein